MNLLRAKVHSLSASSPSESESQLRLLSQRTLILASLLRAGFSLSQAAQQAQLELGVDQDPSPQGFLSEVWRFVLDTGAAPAAVFDVCAEVFASAAQNAREARVQMAGPQAAARLVMGLPLIALAGGVVAGYNPFGFLFGTALGWIILCIAGGLMFIAHRWSGRMLRSAQQWSWARGMALEVMAIALSSGQSLSAAHAWANQVGKKFLDSEESTLELDQCSELAQLSRSTGVAIVGLLRDRAKQVRMATQEQSQMRVEKLAVQLMIPLGVCVLPAFIAVGVLPIVASMISSTALKS